MRDQMCVLSHYNTLWLGNENMILWDILGKKRFGMGTESFQNLPCDDVLNCGEDIGHLDGFAVQS